MKINSKAYNFTLPDENGNLISLSDYAGKWVVLYFYPKDDTPGCTIQACNFRDSIFDFNDLNSVVLGISVDSVSIHLKFKQKYKLNFTLLSDNDCEVVKKYGVWNKKIFMGKEYMGITRTTFLINPQNEIMKVYEKVDPELNFKEILEDLKLFQKLNN